MSDDPSDGPGDDSRNEEAAWHRQVAVEQFNKTWDLIDLADPDNADVVRQQLASIDQE